jgi:hypothetical protein
MQPDRPRRPLRDVAPLAASLTLLTLMASACGGGGRGAVPAAAPGPVSDAVWRSLATPRPTPLPGAVRVAVGRVRILGNGTLGLTSAVDLDLTMSELVAAGLLRRRDVQFVERRRFVAAVEAERAGRPRTPGAPAAGVSEGAQLVASATWSSVGLDSAYLEVALVDAESGRMAGARRSATPNGADPAAIARDVVASVLSILDELGRRPAWDDPEPSAAPPTYRPSGVPLAALDAFMNGVAAEARWNWDGARVGYATAMKAGGPGFVEAAAALARAARLRQGGTLGAG